MPDDDVLLGAPEGGQLEGQPTAPVAEPEPDEGVPADVEVRDGRVDASVIARVRKETRDKAERRIRDQEVEPLRRQAQDMEALKRQNEELLRLFQQQQQPTPAEPTSMEARISDEEAMAEARDLDLYDPQTHQPDVARAKRIIARRRQELEQVADMAARRHVAPVTQQTAAATSRQNFAQMALARDHEGRAWVDAKELAQVWAQLPTELTAVPEVAELVLDSVIGKGTRTRARGRVAAPGREPTFSEPAGGRGAGAFALGDVERKMARAAGITDKQYEETAKGFQPGGPNVIGE